MFGYVTVNKPELKLKDYYRYRAFYCGLCKTLNEKYGLKGRITLTYDMTFLIILLTSLYEEKSDILKECCMLHPFTHQHAVVNDFTNYAADMNIILAYYNLADNWQDDSDIKSLTMMKMLKKDSNRIKSKYKRQCKVIADEYRKISKCEKEDGNNIDAAAYHFGKITEEIFVYKKDIWEDNLRKMGFYLGKFIYLMDAYDDLEEDIENGNYNVFKQMSEEPGFDEECKQILIMMMAECSRNFEKLPIIKNADILRNILYSGVWLKWDMKHSKKRSRDESV